MVLASSIPANLPALRGKFNGRAAELNTIRELLSKDEVRLVTLTGFGGAGKTTLAIHAAHAMMEFFSGGLFFIDLTPITEPTFLLPAIAKVLGVQEEPNLSIADILRDFLANRSILFVLDNFEQVIEAAPIISDFLDANPHVNILVTSREALRLRGEQVLPIAPLEDADAIQTFVQYAQAVNPQFRLTEDNTPAITELCKKLDGLPLAIELAAMRTRMFTPQALLARLQSDLGVDSPLLATLTSGPRDLPARQQTMRATIAWSYSLLNEKEQRLLQVMSLFASGVSILPLVSVSGIPEQEALESLASLVDKSLVVPIAFESLRFRLLEGIREFAHEQASLSSERSLWNENFVAAFYKVAREAGDAIETGDALQGSAQIELESANLLAALDITFTSQNAEMFSRGVFIMECLEQHWYPHQLFSEAGQYIRRAFKRLDDLDVLEQDVLGILYSLEGSFQWSHFNYKEAVENHAKAVASFEKSGDEKRLGRALNNLAVNLDETGVHDEANAHYERALLLVSKTRDVWNEIRVLGNLGIRYHQILGDDERALESWLSALELARQQGRVYEHAFIEFNIACLKYAHSDYDDSETSLRNALNLARENNFPHLEAFSSAMMGMIDIERKDISSASVWLFSALQSCRSKATLPVFHEVLQAAAVFGAVRKQYKPAAFLLGGADAQVSKDLAYRVLPIPHGLETIASTLRSALGRSEYDSMFNQGRLASVDELHNLANSICEPVTTKKHEMDDNLSIFTERELEVLRLLAQGRTNEEISNELVIVLKTVEKHVANILRKLGVKNRTEVAAWYLENTNPRQTS